MALPGKGLSAGFAGRDGAIAHPRASISGRANKRRVEKLCGEGADRVSQWEVRGGGGG